MPSESTDMGFSRFGTWEQQYREQIGTSPLEDISVLHDSLDITRANQTGIAGLFASGHVSVAALFHEPGDRTAAGRELSHIMASCEAYERSFGYAQIDLAVGIASWERSASLPVLLYPVRIDGARNGWNRKGADSHDASASGNSAVFSVLRGDNSGNKGSSGNSGELARRLGELEFYGQVSINPVLIDAFKSRGVSFDPAALLRASEYEDGVLDASAVLAKIDALASRAIDGFTIRNQFIVGCFEDPRLSVLSRGHSIVAQVAKERTNNDFIDALVGDTVARGRATAGTPEPFNPADPDPHDEFEIGDVSNQVRYAARLAARGFNVFVSTPSNGGSALAAASIASRLAFSGKTVLYVPFVNAQKKQFLDAGTKLGIGDAMLDITSRDFSHDIDARLVAAVGYKPSSATAGYNQLADELVGIQARLSRYFGDFHSAVEPWGVSAYETIENLAHVAARPTHPATRIRLSAPTAQMLMGKLDDWGSKLIRAGELGEFSIHEGSTPWFHASIFSDKEAQSSFSRIVRVVDELLPKVREHIQVAVKTSGFPIPKNMAEWADEVAVMKNLRRVLDVFQKEIFERDLPQMIVATQSKAERREAEAAGKAPMGYWERRRFIKEAKALLRPGTKVENLHQALSVVNRQYQLWRKFVQHGSWPTLPVNLDEIIATLDRLTDDLTALESALSTTPTGGGLLTSGFVSLEKRLSDLHADGTALKTLPARASLEREFDAAGLTALLVDLRDRKVAPSSSPDELCLAWWTTVFEVIIKSSPVIANQDGSVLIDAAERFCQVDADHVGSIGAMIEAELMKRASELLYARSKDANLLHTLLAQQSSQQSKSNGSAQSRTPDYGELFAAYPKILSAAKPIIASSPAYCASVLNSEPVADVVIIDAAAHAQPLEVLTVLPLARQIVIFGASSTISSPIVKELKNLCVDVAPAMLPAGSMSELALFLKDNGYNSVVIPADAPGTSHIAFHYVEAVGLLSADSQLIETSRQEIETVSDLVARKAAEHRFVFEDYSLNVITLSALNAQKIQVELDARALKDGKLRRMMPQIHVCDLSQVAGVRPGDIVLSLGFAKTPQGKFLQRFGQLEETNSQGVLLDALSCVRGSLDIVGAFTADDMDDTRLRQGGSKLLKRLLEWVVGLGTPVPGADPESSLVYTVVKDDSRPLCGAVKSYHSVLMEDLAARLVELGLIARVGYGVAGGQTIPLVVSEKDHAYRVAVMTDDTDFMDIPSMRIRHRMLPEILEAHGWKVVRVWSVAAFVNPQKEVERIVRAVNDTDATDVQND